MNATKSKPAPVMAAPALPTFTDLERIALACVSKDDVIKAAKKNLKPGTYKGEMALQIHYVVSKAEATDAMPTVDVLTPEIVARAMQHLGLKPDLFLAGLHKAATEVLLEPVKLGKVEESKVQEIVDRLNSIRDQVQAKMEKTPRSGSTRLSQLGVRRLEIQPGLVSWMGEAA